MHRPVDLPGLTAHPCARRHPHAQENPLRADPAAQLKLLELQDLDAKADQLAHRRSHLPAIALIADLERDRARVQDSVRDARVDVDDLTAEQRKVDAEVEQVRSRRTRDQDRLDRGLVTSPKDLERIQHELVSLERRITTLEDSELEVMEQVEDAQRLLADLQQELDGIERRLAELAEERDAAVAEIDAQAADVTGARTWATDGIPADLLALYDRLRAQKMGIGASELRQRQCGGCRLGIDHAELSRIASLPAEEVVRCEECSRILVRTAESGL